MPPVFRPAPFYVKQSPPAAIDRFSWLISQARGSTLNQQKNSSYKPLSLYSNKKNSLPLLTFTYLEDHPMTWIRGLWPSLIHAVRGTTFQMVVSWLINGGLLTTSYLGWSFQVYTYRTPQKKSLKKPAFKIHPLDVHRWAIGSKFHHPNWQYFFPLIYQVYPPWN